MKTQTMFDKWTFTADMHVGGNEFWCLAIQRADDEVVHITFNTLAEAQAFAAMIAGSVREFEFRLLNRAVGGKP